MKDPRYKFTITVSTHILLVKDKNKLLLAKRPDSWEWGPNRWGLPGGKIYEHESILECIKRKTKQELGFEVATNRIYKIKQLIIKDKQAFMFYFLAKYKGQKIKGEMAEYKWFDIEEIIKTPINNFSEYFYKQMLASFLEEKKVKTSIGMIDGLDYVKLSDSKDYKMWFKGMINKNYNTEQIPDFKKWTKSIK